MNLTLSLRGPDLVGVARGLQARGLAPSGLPVRLQCDDRLLGSSEKWLEIAASRAKSELRAVWQDDSFFLLSPATVIVKLDRRSIDLDLRKLADDLAAIPFETAVFAPRRFSDARVPHPEGWLHGHGLTGAHYQAGWGIALRGEGHLHLVSRRFLTHGGPWRVVQAANDTTVIQFHDLAVANAAAAWAQAKPCVERLTYQPGLDTCGLVDTAEDVYAPSGAKYEAAAKTLWVAAGDRTIAPREMRDAAEDRFNARVKPGKWRALEKVAYLFPSETRARAHLHELWLRDLQCWYESGGRRVRLDDAHKPAPPAPPAWLAQAGSAPQRPSEPPPDRPSAKRTGEDLRAPLETDDDVETESLADDDSSEEPSLSEINDFAETAGPDEVGDLADQPSPAKISAFAEKPYPELKRSAARSKTLTDAIDAVKKPPAGPPLSAADQKRLDQVAFAIVKVGAGPGPLEYAGWKENDMLFSASLLKVALLYASHELVARVNALAPTLTASDADDFFDKVDRALRTEIRSAVPSIVAGPWREVQYAQVLTARAVAPGKYRVKLQSDPKSKTDYLRELARIFADQEQDEAARYCVRRLGFSYVNGALAAGGFLDVKSEKGIWLATDYDEGGWPSVYVPVTTRGRSSVAMTALAMARLLTAMHRRELVDHDSSKDMVATVSLGGAWLSETSGAGAMSFTDTGAKVGHWASADAKVGMVTSEGAFLKRKSDGAVFVAVWQNFPEKKTNGVDDTLPVYRVIDEVVKNWP